MDNGVYCESAAERTINDAEGSPMGAMLRAVNAIAQALEDDFPHVTFDTLAYTWSQRAPNMTRPRHNVAVRLCTITLDFARPLTHENNQPFYDDLVAWALLTQGSGGGAVSAAGGAVRAAGGAVRAAGGQLHVWDYITNFNEYLTPFPNWRILGANYATLASFGVSGLFAEGVYSSRGGDLVQLKDYLVAQLLLRPTTGGFAHTSVDALIDTFLTGYYGPPAAKQIDTYMRILERAAQRNASMVVSENFASDDEWLDEATVLAAASAMVAAEGATRAHASSRVEGARAMADAEGGSHPASRFLPRVIEAGLPIMYVALRRWDALRTFHSHQADIGQPCDWPYAPSLAQQFGVFSARFEELSAPGEPMWLGEAAPTRNMTWLRHALFDHSPSAPPPSPPAPPEPPPLPPPPCALGKC